MEEQLKDKCNRLRADLLKIEQEVRSIKRHSDFEAEQSRCDQHGESIAQSMLAVRRIEDARMRLGKVIQHMGDGVSVYDK